MSTRPRILQTQLQKAYGAGKGKYRLKSPIIKGMDTRETAKLTNMNWLTISLFPPERSVKMGIAVSGGTEASKSTNKAMGKGGLLSHRDYKHLSGNLKLLVLFAHAFLPYIL